MKESLGAFHTHIIIVFRYEHVNFRGFVSDDFCGDWVFAQVHLAALGLVNQYGGDFAHNLFELTIIHWAAISEFKISTFITNLHLDRLAVDELARRGGVVENDRGFHAAVENNTVAFARHSDGAPLAAEHVHGLGVNSISKISCQNPI